MSKTLYDEKGRELVSVRIAALQARTGIDLDLYLPAVAPAVPKLYAAADCPPTSGALEKLIKRGLNSLLVPRTQVTEFRNRLRELIESGVDIAPNVRLEVAREAAKDSFHKAWRQSKADTLVSNAAEFSHHVVDVCQDVDEMGSVLASIAEHDGDTFAHVTNVCTYVVMLAKGQGISNDHDLMRLGQAALLHDVGKRKIHGDILRKPGALTPKEREIIGEHPRLGFEELCQQSHLDRDQLLMVYQHHERVDGKGYPVRLVGSEIHWTAQICAIVDVFDALTAQRAYRKAMALDEAVEFIQSGAGKHFADEYAHCWIDLVTNAMVATR